MAGAPLGNQNAVKGKRWEQAIVRAIEAWPNPPDNKNCAPLIVGLNAAAHAFVAKMYSEQDLGFFKEFGDRLDGKAHQSTELTGKDGGPVVIHASAHDEAL